MKSLQRLNIIATVLHLVQGVAILLLANDFALPVTSFFWNDAPNNRLDVTRLDRMFDVSVAWAGATFLFLSALFHFIVSTVGRSKYDGEIAAEQNRFRWVEYSISSTLMILTICLVFGIGDVAGLIGIAGANVAMILFGWIMEVVNKPGREVWWTPFWFGCIAGIVPWIALFFYVVGPGSNTPSFVYGIFVSLFIFFNLFALNQWLQYRRVGKWAAYAYGERVYLVLSLVAKSLLAWQIFGNTLAV
jgi:hypothetical protein